MLRPLGVEANLKGPVLEPDRAVELCIVTADRHRQECAPMRVPRTATRLGVLHLGHREASHPLNGPRAAAEVPRALLLVRCHCSSHRLIPCKNKGAGAPYTELLGSRNGGAM